jgi:hypothetical protein
MQPHQAYVLPLSPALTTLLIQIVSSNFSTIECVTAPSVSNLTTPGFRLANGTTVYPGMRGIAFESYGAYNSNRFSDLSKLGSLVTVSSTNGTRSELQGSWITPLELYGKSNYCTRSSAFFRPAISGNYTFWLSADDIAQLNGTWTSPVGHSVKKAESRDMHSWENITTPWSGRDRDT